MASCKKCTTFIMKSFIFRMHSLLFINYNFYETNLLLFFPFFFTCGQYTPRGPDHVKVKWCLIYKIEVVRKTRHNLKKVL